MLGYGAIGQFTIGQVSDFIGPIVQPWTDPPQPKIKAGLAIALIASGLSAPVFIKDESKLESRWHQPLSEPIRKLERIGLRDRYPFIASAVHIGWFNPLSEPVRRIRATLTPAPIVPTIIGEIITIDKWFSSFAEPIRNKSGLRVAYQRDYFAEPFSLTQPETVTESRWHQSWSEPVRKKEDRVGIRVRYPFIYGSVYMSWFGPLSEPNPRTKSGLSAANQQTATFYPFPFPPVTATIGWFNNLSDPVRIIRPTPTDQQSIPYQPIIPSFGWYGNLSDPIRRIRKASPYEQPSWSLFQEPAPTISFGWYDPFSEPTRIKEDKIGLRVRYPFIYGSVYMSWFSNLSEPIRIKLRLNTAHQQALAFYPFPLPPPITVDNISWFNNLSDPTRRIRPTPTDQEFLPLFPPTPSFGWFDGLTDPARRIRVTASFDSQASVPLPTVSFGWFRGLADPSRRPQTVSFDPQNFVFQITPTVFFGWFGALNEPPRRKPSPISLDRDFSPFPLVSFSWFGNLSEPVRQRPRVAWTDHVSFQFPIVSFSWFGGLSEPVRKRPRVAWTDHISFQFPIVPFSWFNRLDDPTLPKKRVIDPPYFSFSPNPIQLSFGWYGNLTEPVRKKPKVWEGIYEARPIPVVIINYLASLSATEQRDFLLAILYQFNPPLRAYVDIIENDPRHRGNLGIIENAPEPSIIASIVPQSPPATGGTPVPTVAGARVAIITG